MCCPWETTQWMSNKKKRINNKAHHQKHSLRLDSLSNRFAPDLWYFLIAILLCSSCEFCSVFSHFASLPFYVDSCDWFFAFIFWYLLILGVCFVLWKLDVEYFHGVVWTILGILGCGSGNFYVILWLDMSPATLKPYSWEHGHGEPEDLWFCCKYWDLLALLKVAVLEYVMLMTIELQFGL